MHGQGFAASRWLLASTVGLAVGIPAGLALGAPLEVIVGAMIVTPLMLALCGLFLGTSQWIALRGVLPQPTRWVPLTIVGFAAGLTIAVVAVETGGALLTGSPVRIATADTLGLLASVLVVGGFGGALLGVTQALALRHCPGALAKWAKASAVGLASGFGTGALMASALGGMMSGVGVVVFLVVSGPIYAAITGRTLRTMVLSM